MHECPGPECGKLVPDEMLACPRHWYQVPKPMRDAVYKAWNRGAGAGSAAHYNAMLAAIGRMHP